MNTLLANIPMDVKIYNNKTIVNLSDGSFLKINYGITVDRQCKSESVLRFHKGTFRSCVLSEYIEQLELVTLPQLPEGVDSVCSIGVHEYVFIDHNNFEKLAVSSVLFIYMQIS